MRKKQKQILFRQLFFLAGSIAILNYLIESAKACDFFIKTKEVHIEINSDKDIAVDDTAVIPESRQTTDGDSTALRSENPPTVEVIKQNSGQIDWKVLYGIFIKETQGDCSRIGDTHLPKPSIGCYQWNLYFHPEADINCLKDLACSTKMTAERLSRYAKIGGIDYAIRKHNGSANNPDTLTYLNDVKRIMSEL